MNKDLLSNSLTNEQLVQSYPDQVESGNVFVYYTKETDNPDFVDVYMAQNRIAKRAANLDAAEHKISKLERQLKGWDLPTLVRHRDVFSKKRLDERAIAPGYVFDNEIVIMQSDSIKARDRVQKENPRQNNEGKVLVTADGFPIFRTTSIDHRGEVEELDFVLDYSVSDETVKEYVESLEPVGEEILS